MPIRLIKALLRMDSITGIILILAAIAAMILNNSIWQGLYQQITHFHFDLNLFGDVKHFGLVHFVNDFLMVGFFLVVGLEIRREISVGELSTVRQAILPVVAAIAGMVFPVIFFLIFNVGSPENIKGWAIPSATDIAFALAILNLFGRRVPISLKIFLTALAIIDDLGAILVIAFFYSTNLSWFWILGAAVLSAITYIIRQARFVPSITYLLLGLLIWYAVFNSGIHATIAGVLIAWLLPEGLGAKVEHALLPICAYFILPFFAFLNSGVILSLSEISRITEALPLGILLGLFLGKQLGIFFTVYVFTKLKLAKLPRGANYLHMYGVAALAGVGFTMSLFIGRLAFNTEEQMQLVRLGVIAGSLLSGLWGAALISLTRKPKN